MLPPKNNATSATLLVALISLSCSHLLPTGAGSYAPPAVFAAYVGNDYDTLPGNSTWPNTCRLAGDTVRMYFFSGNFAEANNCRSGDLLRLDLLPGGNDTLFGIRNIIFHLARYLETNYSYTVVPADTLQNQYTVSLRAVRLLRRHGGRVELDNISIQTNALSITRGRITGTIE